MAFSLLTDEDVGIGQLPNQIPQSNLQPTPKLLSDEDVGIISGGVTDVPKGGVPVQVSPGNNPVKPGELSGVGEPMDWVNAFSAGWNPFQDEMSAAISSMVNNRPYEGELAAFRGRQEQLGEQAPGTKFATEMAGALGAGVVTGGALAAPNTMRAMMMQAFKVGTAFGLVQGFGNAEGGLKNRAVGAAVGTGIGAATAPLGALTGMALTKAVMSATSAFRAIFNPQKEAEIVAGKAIGKDIELGREALTTPQADAADAAGVPIMNIDRGGAGTRDLAHTSANISEEAKNTLTSKLTQRSQAQSERTEQFFKDLVYGNPNAVGTSAYGAQQEIKAAQRAALKPAYETAYTAGDKPIWSSELERLTNSPMVQNAMKRAEAEWKNFAVADGFGGMNPPIKITPDGRIVATGGKGQKTYPNLQFWDYTKRALDTAIDEAGGPGTTAGGVLSRIKRHLTKELDDLVPEYQATRGLAKRFYDASDSLEAGELFLARSGTKAMSMDEAADLVAKMTPTERQLFKQGAFKWIEGKLSKFRENRSGAIQAIFGNRDLKNKMQIVFGNDYTLVEARLLADQATDLAQQAIKGYSTTYRQALAGLASPAGQAVAGALAGEGYGIAHGDYSLSPSRMLGGAIIFGATRLGFRAMHKRVAEEIATLLTSNDPAMYQRGIDALAKSKRLLAIFRDFGNSFANVATNQGSALTARGVVDIYDEATE